MHEVKSESYRTVENICAVIVTYYPDIHKLEKLIYAIKSQVNSIVIINNSPEGGLKDHLSEIANTISLSIQELGKNFGVAAGHNRGIEWARTHEYNYVLLLDQDSIPASDMVLQLLTVSNYLKSQGQLVAAVGPRYRDPTTGHLSLFVRFGLWRFHRVNCNSEGKLQCVPVDFLISSGLLISLKTLEMTGEMDESLFIDHVDTEWFLRAKSKGHCAYGVCDAIMEHSLGNDTRRIWLGRWRHFPVHAPLRHYYIFRNSVLLYKRKYAPVQWILNDIVRLVVMFFVYSLMTAPRLEHCLSMLRGLKDGFLGRTGKCDSAIK